MLTGFSGSLTCQYSNSIILNKIKYGSFEIEVGINMFQYQAMKCLI